MLFWFRCYRCLSYDTIRDAILTCTRKPTCVSLIYRTSDAKLAFLTQMTSIIWSTHCYQTCAIFLLSVILHKAAPTATQYTLFSLRVLSSRRFITLAVCQLQLCDTKKPILVSFACNEKWPEMDFYIPIRSHSQAVNSYFHSLLFPSLSFISITMEFHWVISISTHSPKTHSETIKCEYKQSTVEQQKNSSTENWTSIVEKVNF